MELKELMNDCAQRQKKGLHFIMSSVVIWGLICAAHLTDLTIEQKNLLTFCCSAVLFPSEDGDGVCNGVRCPSDAILLALPVEKLPDTLHHHTNPVAVYWFDVSSIRLGGSDDYN